MRVCNTHFSPAWGKMVWLHLKYTHSVLFISVDLIAISVDLIADSVLMPIYLMQFTSVLLTPKTNAGSRAEGKEKGKKQHFWAAPKTQKMCVLYFHPFASFGCHNVSIRVQELCESRGGRPGLLVLMSLTVSVDVKQHWTMLRQWSLFVPNMSITDIRGHEALHHHHLESHATRAQWVCPRAENSAI